MKTYKFSACLEMIGVNPFVFVPDEILKEIFLQAGKEKGHIPICGNINGKSYRQTLVKFQGKWRLYINTSMLKNSPKRIGEILEITVRFDPESREMIPPLRFTEALKENPAAKDVFDKLPTSRKLEIVRYLARLKTEESLEKERFIGREKP